MIRPDLDFLFAQVQSLTQMLADLPPDEIIERTGLQSRLNEIQSQLNTLSIQPARSAPAVVDLTFKGNPVSGFLGIKADFAAKALAAFERSIATIGASLTRGELRDSGRVPDRSNHQLLITGCVTGSFGFRLEEIVDEQAQPTEGPTSISESVQQILAILEACVTSDERLVDALGDASPRVLVPIKDFLTVIHNAAATCGLAVNGSHFRFENTAAVEEALDRATIGVQETSETHIGVLRGLLPDSRKFDFKTEGNALLSGKVDRMLGVLDSMRDLVDKPCTAKLQVRIAGRVRQVRRYTLLELVPQQ
jgi:hypothetical protein